MMASLEQADQKVVFGLDIGTRSVVGTVGYMNDGQFNVIAQSALKHQTRAMLDGQIHDIGKVGATIKQVKESLEQQTDIPQQGSQQSPQQQVPPANPGINYFPR